MNIIIGCGTRQEDFSNHDMKLIRFLSFVKGNWWFPSSDTCFGSMVKISLPWKSITNLVSNLKSARRSFCHYFCIIILLIILKGQTYPQPRCHQLTMFLILSINNSIFHRIV